MASTDGSTSEDIRFNVGRMKFDAKRDVSTYVICKFKADPEKSEADSARGICTRLFSGQKPAVGWWKSNQKSNTEASTDVDHANEADFYWKPKAIVSVTGGAQDFAITLAKDEDENQALMHKISDGILKAAHIFEAMIVDGGSNSGVMKLIGEAVARDGNHIATLGIFPFGAVKNTGLESKRSYGVHDINKAMVFDRNHHYFALIDDGINEGKKAWGTELSMRYEIEFALSKSDTKSQLESTDPPILPHVLVVVNGGPGTLSTVCKLSQLYKNDGEKVKVIPIVVVEGTGRAADLIAKAWNFRLEKDKQKAEAQAKKKEVEAENKVRVKQALDKAPESNNSLQSKESDKPFEIHKLVEDKQIDKGSESKAQHGIEAIDPKIDPNTDSSLNDTFEAFLAKTFKILFPNENDTEVVDKTIAEVEKICNICMEENQNLISIHDVRGKHSLAYTIMKSVCTGSLVKSNNALKQLDPIEQLKLVLSWNDSSGEAIEMAKNEILSQHALELRIEKKLTDLLIAGMKRSQVKFVEMLLDFDVDMPSGKTIEDQLYTETENENTTHGAIIKGICSLLHRKHGESSFVVTENENAKQGSFTKKKQVESTNKKQGESMDWNQLLKYVMGWEEFHEQEDSSQQRTREHLFLSCILTCNEKMAEIFWWKCHPDMRQHCISRALFACAIARKLGPHLPAKLKALFSADDDDDDSERTDLASRFESIAKELLDRCYEKSPQAAVLTLTCPLLHPSQSVWIDKVFKGGSPFYNQLGNVGGKFLTPIMLAYDAQAESFVEHEAFQECLDRIWYGRLVTHKDNSYSGEEQIRGFRVYALEFLGWLFRGDLFQDFAELFLMLDIVILSVFSVLIPFCKYSDGVTQKDAEQPKSFFLFTRRKLLALYSSPIVKFYQDFASYLTFLVIYTYVGIRMDYDYTSLEGVMHAWIIALALNELRDYCEFGKRYMTSISNVFDIAMIGFYIPAAALRWYERAHFSETSFLQLGGGNSTDPSNHAGMQLGAGNIAFYDVAGWDFIKARSWHGLAGILFWMRITDFFRVSKQLGPLMLVLMKVFWDAFQFFVILLIFIISFGAAMICAARPRWDDTITMAEYVDQMIFFPYLAIFGEHFMDATSLSWSDYPLCNAQDSSCSPDGKLGIILLCLYLFVSSILLMNLLIAMMNSSYTKVLSKSTKAWKLQRLEFVVSYTSKSLLPMPLSIVPWLFSRVKALVSEILYIAQQQQDSKTNQQQDGSPNDTPKSEEDSQAKQHQCGFPREKSKQPYIHVCQLRLTQYNALEAYVRQAQGKAKSTATNKGSQGKEQSPATGNSDGKLVGSPSVNLVYASTQELGAQERRAKERIAREPTALEPGTQKPTAEEPTAPEPTAQELTAQEHRAQELWKRLKKGMELNGDEEDDSFFKFLKKNKAVEGSKIPQNEDKILQKNKAVEGSKIPQNEDKILQKNKAVEGSKIPQNEDKMLMLEMFKAMRGFREGMTVGEILYQHDEMMASLYEDVYHEPLWLKSWFEPHEARIEDKARVMRNCINTIVAEAAKWTPKSREPA